MDNYVSSGIVEQWLQGWSLSRELPLPVRFRSGFKVDVGYEKQQARYVFAELNDDVMQLFECIDEPWVFLKICAAPEAIKPRIPGKWIMQPQGYMMCCCRPMPVPDIRLPGAYRLEYDCYNSTFVVRIVTQDDVVAAIGRVVLVGDMAVYDRISTAADHRRKGLATFLMKALEKIALSEGAVRNFLVATAAGRSLYQALGWQLYSLYTSFCIGDRALPGSSLSV